MVWPGELGPQSQACSLTMWSDSNESKDRESSVSSGHLSGSSGGHKSSELPLGSWTERPPQVLGPPRQPRMSNPRLEQLRDKIRVQAQRQASCASLATSTPSSSFTHYKDPVLMPQRKTRKPCSATPLTLVDTDFSEPSVAELKAVGQVGQEPAKVDRCQASAPRGKARRMKSCSCKREKASKPVAPRGTSKDNGFGENTKIPSPCGRILPTKDLEGSTSPGHPVRAWSKVTSGMVLGDQETPSSFCLCLNRALNQAETGDSLNDWDGVPSMAAAGSSQGPLRVQGLTTCSPCPSLCIYLDPKEAERLGISDPLHLRHKQARVQALETMANILQQRIDMLTTKLLQPDMAAAPGDLGRDHPPSSPSTKSTLLMSKAPGCTRTVVPSRGRRALQDWADKQSKLLFTPTCLLDSETVPWRSDAISKPQEFEENLESADLEKRLARHTTSLGDLSTFARSSHRVTPDPSCGSLKLEDMLVPPRVSPVEPWTVRSFGQHNPDQPPPGHLAFMQQKSLSFLESLKLGQQKREQVLALLQLRVELEVWETQKALDQLLFKRRLERLMGGYSTHARPESAPGLEQLKVYGDPELAASLRPSAVTPRSQALLDGDPNGTTTSQAPKDMQESQTEPLQKGRLDHAPSQARLYLQDNPTFQMLEQSLREEELHAQHQAALLRLREKALEEKTRTELAFLEHQRGFLSSMGNSAVLATLAERRQQALSKQEQEQREIHYLQSISQLEHRERMLLLQHQQDMALVQRAVTQLRWELQARPRLLQNSNPEDKAASKGASSASQQLGGHTQDSSCRPTQLQPGSHSPWRSPKSPQISHLPTEQQDKTAPRAAALVDCHLQSPPKLRPSWEEVTPADVGRLTLVAPSKLVENADRCVGQEPEARPHVPLLGLQDMTALDTGRAPSPTFLVDKEEGGLSAAGLRLLEGDPHTDPSPSLAEKTQAFLESQAGSVQTLRLPSFSLDSEGPHSPPEASQEAEGSACGKGVDSGLECANGFMREPYKTESRRTGDQRTESCWQKLSNTTHQEAASTASREAVQPAGSPWHSFVAEDLSSESASPPRTCSMSSARSSASSVSDLSWPSLQEFQKASAILVQLSQSSLSDWEAEGVAATNPDRPKDSVGPHQDVGQGTWEKVEGTEASPLQGQSPVAGDPEPAGGHLYTGWPEPLPVNPSPRSGSELPAASNEVWDEEKQPKLGTSGHFSPAGDSTDLESCGVPSSLDSGEGKETSGTNGSLSSGSITGKSKQTCPVAASTAFLCSASSSSSDLVLSPSFPSGTPASKRPDFDKEETRSLQALVDCLGGHKDAAPSPSTDRKPISEPEVPVSLQASPGDPSGLPNSAGMNLAPRHGKNRALPVLREVPPARAGIALPEILSPVDEVLSYSSADFPSSTCRDSHLPPPPSLPTENEADASPYSYDFPSPPTDSALFPGGSLGPQGEDTSMEAEFPSLSEEDLPKALSLGAQGLGLCLEGLEGKFDGLSSGAEVEAVGGLWSEPVQWPGSSLSEQAGSAFGSTPGLLVQSLNPTRETHKAGDSVPKLLVTEEAGPPGPVQEDSGLGTGPHTDPHGMETTEAVDLVSTQLSRRILCDTMTVLSRLAQSGSALGQEPASAKQVPDTQMEADQRGPETHRCL
ncbi:coiled-coil domain-containing protein 187 [Erinaceus europaeus]|uniref:Coiled-coil domain-containing protein 187 n=1 Tax=Erinaceus europaeus TaxID=9365 RepID=A0ABM3Y1N7_ERIEU|nr:coiled-coil domain-containing protein 187 [Erinaceus europaeus]